MRKTTTLLPLILLALAGAAMAQSPASPPFATLPAESAQTSAQTLATEFAKSVPSSYQVALTDTQMAQYKAALSADPVLSALSEPEFVVLVNRNTRQQHMAIFLANGANMEFIGAAKVSSGAEGRKEYFYTPTGLFENKLENGNYRAEGTKNENGIRGYGAKGMRVFDFGWQESRAGWGNHFDAKIRLQMHATDPDYLEQRLGKPASKGCVRIHHDVNRFIDEHGVLDKNYDNKKAWVISKNKKPSSYDGRYMLVVDIE